MMIPPKVVEKVAQVVVPYLVEKAVEAICEGDKKKSHPTRKNNRGSNHKRNVKGNANAPKSLAKR